MILLFSYQLSLICSHIFTKPVFYVKSVTEFDKVNIFNRIAG